jgi:hypothetical protein
LILVDVDTIGDYVDGQETHSVQTHVFNLCCLFRVDGRYEFSVMKVWIESLRLQALQLVVSSRS